MDAAVLRTDARRVAVTVAACTAIAFLLALGVYVLQFTLQAGNFHCDCPPEGIATKQNRRTGLQTIAAIDLGVAGMLAWATRRRPGLAGVVAAATLIASLGSIAWLVALTTTDY